MIRPVIWSKQYYLLCFGTFAAMFIPYMALCYFFTKYAYIWFGLMFVGTIWWSRLISWAQGERRTIWSKWEGMFRYTRTRRDA